MGICKKKCGISATLFLSFFFTNYFETLIFESSAFILLDTIDFDPMCNLVDTKCRKMYQPITCAKFLEHLQLK